MFKNYDVINTSTSDLFSNYVGAHDIVPSAIPAPQGLPWAESGWLHTAEAETFDKGSLKSLALGRLERATGTAADQDIWDRRLQEHKKELTS